MKSKPAFSAKLDPKQSFTEDILPRHLQERENLFREFSRHITHLLESREPRRFSSNRGLLNTRKLHQYSYNDQVFYRHTQTPNSDTTFVFLIDASGSMRSGDRMAKCTAVVSAFAKANHFCERECSVSGSHLFQHH
jgi:cobalamin biosynthesis protein CobT